jgi:hypothetical protein
MAGIGQLKVGRMVMIPRKIESGMDTTNDRRMTENGPIYERRMDGKDWFNYSLYRDGNEIHYE